MIWKYLLTNILTHEVSGKFWFEWWSKSNAPHLLVETKIYVMELGKKKKDKIWLISFMIGKECWRQTTWYGYCNAYFVSKRFFNYCLKFDYETNFYYTTRQKASLKFFLIVILCCINTLVYINPSCHMLFCLVR